MVSSLMLSRNVCKLCCRHFHKAGQLEDRSIHRKRLWRYAAVAAVAAGGAGYYSLDSHQRRLLKVTAGGVVRFIRFVSSLVFQTLYFFITSDFLKYIFIGVQVNMF
jgi:hypothetical protein